MKTLSIKEMEFGSLKLPTRWWGGIALFDVADSLILMDYCADRGIAVLGGEGFRLKDGYRVPDMESIADFSELADSAGRELFSERSISAMKRFLEITPANEIYFEFILVSP